jgi:hypothetical protein
MSRFLFLLAIISLSFSCNAVSSESVFMPENDLHLQKLVNGSVTEEKFNQVIDLAEEYYTPLFQQFGGTLTIQRRWSDGTVNASASQVGDFWVVNMYGGLARRPEVTPDGFAVVLCHEIGHHLAGYPFVQAWAANEGSSDYYAVLACVRNLWRDGADTTAIDPDSIPATPRAHCDYKWDNINDRKLCYRSMMASKSVSDLLGALRGNTVSFDNHDTAVVSVTNHRHPNAQCRLDTMMAASMCDSSWDNGLIPGKEFSNRNSADAEEQASQVSCGRFVEIGENPLRDIERGYRPKCWFRPLLTP